MSENTNVGIADLIRQLEYYEDDPRTGYKLVHKRICDLRDAGRVVPDDLVRLENGLIADCMAESQGR